MKSWLLRPTAKILADLRLTLQGLCENPNRDPSDQVLKISIEPYTPEACFLTPNHPPVTEC